MTFDERDSLQESEKESEKEPEKKEEKEEEAPKSIEDDFFGFLKDKLGKFKTPKSIDYVDEMPRDPNGKLYKRKLRDPYWEGRERAI